MPNHFLKYFILSISLAFLMSPKGFTQDPSYWQITEEDGLPSRTVYRIAQDSKGYIWLGTSNGLCRYDGKTFKTFENRLLKDKEILHLEIDKNDNIWYLNLAKQVFFLKNGTNQFLDHSHFIDSIQILDFTILKNDIYFICKSKESSNKDLVQYIKYQYNEKGQLSNPISFKSSLSIFDGFNNSGNEIILSGREKLKGSISFHIISGQDEKIIFHKKIETNYKKRSIPVLFKKGNISFYQIERQKLFKHKPDGKDLLMDFSTSNGLNAIRVIDENKYYLTGNGIYFSGENQTQISKNLLLQKFNCNDLFLDQEGNYWVATTNSGLILFSSTNFKIFNSTNSNFPSNEIFCFNANEDKTNLFFGLNNGHLGIMNLATKKIEVKNLNIIGQIIEIQKDKKGNLLIASNRGNTILRKKTLDLISKNLNWYKTILETENQRYIVGKSTGTIEFENLKNYLINSTAASKNLTPNRTYALYEDFSNKLWIGTTNGVYLGSDKTQTLETENTTATYNVSDISQSSDSSIWIATLADGLLRVKNEKIIQVFDKQNGLQSNTCKKIFIDNNKIWISTDKGIQVIDIETNKIEWINKTDGLPTNEINDIYVINDEVWAGTSKGLINFPKKLGHYNQTPPPIHITNFKIWEKDTLFTESLTLTHQQNNFFIGFEGIGFRARGNISYEYKLSGVDKDWVSSPSNSARYPLVNPGDYKFEVFAINEDGIKSEFPATINFTISPPWWKTWWFIGLATLLTIGIATLLFQARLKNIQAKEAREQEFKNKVNSLRQHALQTQMNPHFVFNALNAIQQFLLTNSREEAMTYLSRFARMVRLIFEHSKEQKIGLDQEVEFLNLYLQLEKLRFKEKVKIEFNIDPELEQNNYAIKVPPLLLQPLIENSFKHGLFHKKERGLLKIDFTQKGEMLECVIEDDGVGRAKATELSSWKGTEYESSGLKTAKERLAIINKRGANPVDSDLEIVDLFDSAGQPAGTKVIARILI